tara:strand:- start:210 stop:497 length:288 start_codon:yes stop_codon:yes gene_type:complete
MKTKVKDKWGVDSFEKISNPYKKKIDMKKYWIEKVEYPNGKDGFADCIPYKNYLNKEVALKDFETLVKENANSDTLISLYELDIANDIDNLIKQK